MTTPARSKRGGRVRAFAWVLPFAVLVSGAARAEIPSRLKLDKGVKRGSGLMVWSGESWVGELVCAPQGSVFRFKSKTVLRFRSTADCERMKASLLPPLARKEGSGYRSTNPLELRINAAGKSVMELIEPGVVRKAVARKPVEPPRALVVSKPVEEPRKAAEPTPEETKRFEPPAEPVASRANGYVEEPRRPAGKRATLGLPPPGSMPSSAAMPSD